MKGLLKADGQYACPTPRSREIIETQSTGLERHGTGPKDNVKTSKRALLAPVKGR